jgi:ADP-ribose pyrophosphatase YjhB (NUDIX family)
MHQNYTIFVDGRLCTLVHNPQYSQTFLVDTDGKPKEMKPYDFVEKVKDIFLSLQEGKIQNVSISFHNNDLTLSMIKSAFPKHIIAAGGVVLNSKNEILFIYRNGFWDLPKGKVEAGEDYEEASIREIQEETGIENVTITRPLPVTFHTYKLTMKLVLKETQWFEMFSDDTKLTPQTEEGITEIKWVSRKELPEILSKSYGNIQLLMKDYLKKESV